MIRYCCFSCIVFLIIMSYWVCYPGGGGGARYFLGSTIVLGGGGGGSVARDTSHSVYSEAPGMG